MCLTQPTLIHSNVASARAYLLAQTFVFARKGALVLHGSGALLIDETAYFILFYDQPLDLPP